MSPDRLLAFAASLGCKALEVRDCLRSLAGNGRPASLDEHFATVPRDVNPGWQEAAAAFAAADASWDDARTCDVAWTDAELIEAAPDLAVLDAVNTYEDFLYLTGGDAA